MFGCCTSIYYNNICKHWTIDNSQKSPFSPNNYQWLKHMSHYKSPVWFPRRKRHEVNVWTHHGTLASCICCNVVHLLLCHSPGTEGECCLPKIPSTVTSPQTAGNILPIYDSAQTLCLVIFTSVDHWRSTSKEHGSDMMKWGVRHTDQIFLCRNQTSCIAGTVSHHDRLHGAINTVFNSWYNLGPNQNGTFHSLTIQPTAQSRCWTSYSSSIWIFMFSNKYKCNIPWMLFSKQFMYNYNEG